MGQELREGFLQVLWKGGLLVPATFFLRGKKMMYSCLCVFLCEPQDDGAGGGGQRSEETFRTWVLMQVP